MSAPSNEMKGGSEVKFTGGDWVVRESGDLQESAVHFCCRLKDAVNRSHRPDGVSGTKSNSVGAKRTFATR